jgi:hypothetical protein
MPFLMLRDVDGNIDLDYSALLMPEKGKESDIDRCCQCHITFIFFFHFVVWIFLLVVILLIVSL